VAASFSITYCLLTMGFPALAYAYRGTPIRVSDFVASVWRPAVSSILAGAVLWAYGNASHFSLPQVMLLLIDMGVYATAYVAICVGLPGGRDFVEEIRDILGELRIKKIRKSESLPEGAVDVSIAKGVTP